MKRVLLLIAVAVLTSTMQGCAIYASPYGYSAGYYGYAPYWGVGVNVWPYTYYSYRPYHHPGYGHGFRGWGGGNWGGHWGGHGGWQGR